MIWDNFLFLGQIALSWRHISVRIQAHVGGFRVDAVTLPDRNGEFGEILLQIFTTMVGNKSRNKIQDSYM